MCPVAASETFFLLTCKSLAASVIIIGMPSLPQSPVVSLKAFPVPSLGFGSGQVGDGRPRQEL